MLAERVAEACMLMHQLGLGYAVEQPTPFKGAVTMFQFHSFQALLELGAKMVHFDQCMHGGIAKKPTTVLYSSDFSTLAARCNHPVEQKGNDGTTY